MTPEQKQQVIEIIKHDANGRWQLVNATGTRYCVLGGLLKAAGVDDCAMQRWNLEHEELLAVVYGLNERQRYNLSLINDTYRKVGERRKALITYVQSLPVG